MTEHTTPWPAGTPCWVDLMAIDLHRTQRFYGQLLGWEFTDSDEQYGGYGNATVQGQPVAGLSPTMPGLEASPHVWTVYLATDDVEATGGRVQEAGATTIFEPMQVGPFGRMGLWSDPTGAAFGAWESLEHTGFRILDVHGAPTWLDLMTPDYVAAQDFYSRTFGFTYEEIGMGDGAYSMFSVSGGERPAGGIGQTGADQTGGGEGVPSAWTVCFQHDDVDGAAALLPEIGGSVLQEPWDFEHGRLVAAAGPDGEIFTLLTPPRD